MKRVFVLLFIVFASAQTFAYTVQMPRWYRLDAQLETAPRLGRPVKLSVVLNSFVADIKNVQLRLILPENWTANETVKNLRQVAKNDKETVEFEITPGSYLSPGSIIVEASINPPKEQIIRYVKSEYPQHAQQMKQSILNWPETVNGYVDVSFALTQYESFYPVSSGMWVNYDQNIDLVDGVKGPVFYQNPSLSQHQAQTDIEMFQRLENYMRADSELERQLETAGISVNEKRMDFLNAIYALAVVAYNNRELESAMSLMHRFEDEIEPLEGDLSENLKIAAKNLKGIIYWAQGNNRLAERSFQQAFYVNRRNPLQRYTLRNMGLFMFSRGERNTAMNMYQLAMRLNKNYTLMEREYEIISSD